MGDAWGRGDRYVPIRKLGEGGAGAVWLVEDRLHEGRVVALKELAETSGGREAGLKREFATLAGLRHPSLAEVYDFELAPETGRPRFTLEYVEGEDLVAAVRREGPPLLVEMAAESLRALAFLHDFGIVHRDLKPGNLLVRNRPRLGCRLVVLDFGLALGDTETPVAGAAGTLPYLAPELFGGASASRRSDLYALGAVLFEAVYGRTPIALDPDDTGRFLEAVRSGVGPIPPPPAGYPEGLAGWLAELLDPDPTLRPAQASEALARFNAACGTDHPSEVPASRAARLRSGPPPGRDAEIERLRELLEPAEGSRLVWLCGEPGSGKTRLLRWLARDAILRDREALWLDREHTVEVLRERSQAKPTLVLVDEVETAGDRTLRVLESVARETKGAPIRLVAALQPTNVRRPALRKLLDDTGLVPTLYRVDLEPLDETGMRALAERATGWTTISDARIRWLLDRSEGNPRIAEALLVEGAWEKGARAQVAVAAAPADAPVSGGRLELLSPAGRSWLAALAALEEASPDVLARLSGLDASSAAEAAQEVVAAGLARERKGELRPDSRESARQALEALDPDTRRDLYRRAAGILVEREGPGADAWRLGRLWRGAGEVARAVDCAVRAAQLSMRQAEPADASERLAFAISLLERKDPRRRSLRLKHAEALEEAGLNLQAARAYGAAVLLSKDRAERSEALVGQALSLARAGKLKLALAGATRAAKLARGAGKKPTEAKAKQVMGAALVRLNRADEALPLLEEAAATFQGTADVETYADVLQTLAACKANLRLPEAEQDHRKVIEIFEAAGRPAKALKSMIGLGIVKCRAAEFDEARNWLSRARELADSSGNAHLALSALSWLSAIAIERGELDSAISLARGGMDQALHLGQAEEFHALQGRLTESLIEAGRPAEATALLRHSLEDPNLDEVAAEAAYSFRLLLSRSLAEIDPGDATARTILDATIERLRRERKRRPLLAALVLDMELRAYVDGSHPFEPVKVEFDALAHGAGAALEPEMILRAGIARARYLLARGNWEGAREAATGILEVTEGASYLAHQAQLRAVLAGALEKGGRSEEATRVLKQGRDLLQQAAERIADPAVRRDFLDRSVFRKLREEAPTSHVAGDRRLSSLYELIRILNSETDPDALLESMLDMALRELLAERGMILLRDSDEDSFSVRVARNVEAMTEKDGEAFSRSIVAQAGAGRSVLTLDAGHDERFRNLKSVSLYGIRSLMCVPLRSRGRIIGTVYLDTRKEGALFTEEDLRFLEAFADHAALALENVQRRADLERENRRLQAAADARVRVGNLVGRSPAMQRVFDLVEKTAASDLPILILGESGTGKELVARAIHALSPLRRKTFLSENCAAIPETLLESELFGVVRGAFTGADRDRQGLFEQADGGTLFLDEIGDMPQGMQARLLRVLQEGELRRVGGEKIIKVKVRLLAATNKDLDREVEAGRFRQDLLYRLKVLLIDLPPLRERPGDIALLTEHLLERISAQHGRPGLKVERDVMDLFERYAWPGNVRQLENSLRRLAVLATDGTISRALIESEPELRRALLSAESAQEPVFSLQKSEKEQIKLALRATAGNRDRAARMLGVSRATIYRKIREYGLS